jgi:hypothetical protein
MAMIILHVLLASILVLYVRGDVYNCSTGRVESVSDGVPLCMNLAPSRACMYNRTGSVSTNTSGVIRVHTCKNVLSYNSPVPDVTLRPCGNQDITVQSRSILSARYTWVIDGSESIISSISPGVSVHNETLDCGSYEVLVLYYRICGWNYLIQASHPWQSSHDTTTLFPWCPIKAPVPARVIWCGLASRCENQQVEEMYVHGTNVYNLIDHDDYC